MQGFYLLQNLNGLEDMWEPQYCLQVGSIMFNDRLQLKKKSLILPGVWNQINLQQLAFSPEVLPLNIKSLFS